MEEGLDEMKEHLSSYIVNLRKYKKDKTIGKGAYGQVYLATEKSTGKKYAIKELFFEHLQGRQLKLFCREVQILAKCNNICLLPFCGFTLSYPYSIVTNYVANGSLYEALRHRPRAPKLTSTNKTVIAMGMAYGMAHLHGLKIIHRDLKSLNILLDTNLYPKICDFGIARFKADSETPITGQIGTPHWMAPELFKNNSYDTKVDVYSYAIILWEMLTEDTPFKGQNPMQIMTAVVQKAERPPMPKNVPYALEQLIKLCWATDPTERPTFDDIFTLFKEKKVSFEGTDMKAIDLFIQDLEIDTQERHFNKCSKLPIPPILFSDDNTEDLDFTVLNDFESLDFESKLHSIASSISSKNAEAFFQILIPLIKTSPSIIGTKILEIVRALIVSDSSLFDAFNPFIASLPFENSDLFKPIYCLICDVEQLSPSDLKPEIVEELFKLIDKYPIEIISLFSLISPEYSQNESSTQSIEFMLNNFEKIFNSGGKRLFMKILDNLLMLYPNIKTKYFPQISKIFMKCFVSDDSMIIQYAYRILSKSFNGNLIPAMINDHINNCELRDDVINMLLANSIIPPDDLFEIVLQNKCTKYLVQIAQNIEGLKLFIKYQAKLFQYTDIELPMYILVELCEKPEFLKQIIIDESFLCYISRMLLDESYYSTICRILSKLCINQDHFALLEKKGIIKEVVSKSIEIHNKYSYTSCIFLLISLSGIAFSNDFLGIIPYLDQMCKIDCSMGIIICSFVKRILAYPESIVLLQKSGICKKLSQVNLIPDNIIFHQMIQRTLDPIVQTA